MHRFHGGEAGRLLSSVSRTTVALNTLFASKVSVPNIAIDSLGKLTMSNVCVCVLVHDIYLSPLL